MKRRMEEGKEERTEKRKGDKERKKGEKEKKDEVSIFPPSHANR